MGRSPRSAPTVVRVFRVGDPSGLDEYRECFGCHVPFRRGDKVVSVHGRLYTSMWHIYCFNGRHAMSRAVVAWRAGGSGETLQSFSYDQDKTISKKSPC